jgi:hypothetical protein
MANGRRMIVEPCGGSQCVPIVNNTQPEEENEPTQEYDFNQCGLMKSSPMLTAKALQLKISTGVKNTLRPAEYPWLVRMSIHLDLTSRETVCISGSH